MHSRSDASPWQEISCSFLTTSSSLPQETPNEVVSIVLLLHNWNWSFKNKYRSQSNARPIHGPSRPAPRHLLMVMRPATTLDKPASKMVAMSTPCLPTAWLTCWRIADIIQPHDTRCAALIDSISQIPLPHSILSKHNRYTPAKSPPTNH